VWNQDTAEDKGLLRLLKEDSNDFLGRVTITLGELLTAGTVQEQWYELQKRSNRSTVSGSLHLQFELRAPKTVTKREENSPAVQEGQQLFGSILARLLAFDSVSCPPDLQFAAGYPPISTFSHFILLDFCLRRSIGLRYLELSLLDAVIQGPKFDWRVIRTQFSRLHLVFQREAFPARLPESKRLRRCLRQLEATILFHLCHLNACFPCDSPEGALSACLAVLRDLYSAEVFGNWRQGGESPNEILTLALTAGATMTVRRLLETAPDRDVLQLTHIAKLLADDVLVHLTFFQQAFMQHQVNSALLLSTAYLQEVFRELRQTSLITRRTLAGGDAEKETSNIWSPDFRSQVLDLFLELNDLLNAHPEVRQLSTLPADLADLFAPMMEDWFSNLESRLFQWMRRCLNSDKFVKLSSSKLHSASVAEVVAALQEAISFLSALRWPVDRHAVTFMTRLASVICRRTFGYADELEKLFSEELASAEQASSPSLSQKMLSSFTSKKKEAVNRGCFFSKRMITMINNLEELGSELFELKEMLAPAENARAMANPPASAEIQGVGLLNLVITGVEDLPLAKNFTCNPYVVVKPAGTEMELARVDFQRLTVNPVWHETFSLPLYEPTVALDIYCFSRSFSGEDELLGFQYLPLDFVAASDSQSIILPLKPGGRMNLKVGLISQNPDNIKVAFGVTFARLNSSIYDLVGLGVSKILPVLAEELDHACKPLREGFKLLSKDSDASPGHFLQCLEDYFFGKVAPANTHPGKPLSHFSIRTDNSHKAEFPGGSLSATCGDFV